MNEREFAYRIRHYLNLGTERMDRRQADRLFAARQAALSRQKAEARLSLAGVGNIAVETLLRHRWALAAVVGLALAVAGASHWNSYQQALENEEIDSALLTDDLPINAYLDRGFHAWLDEQHSPQQ